uniref:Uncharacterized protein n=1 Tax=Oryza sativa subsp. japonica TaxID=39947 RepID=Q6K265_ORYSJ|nr:hypothetical protein [Oryza sativa Japonica Group]BAD20106.1 hypothetical protein [Oryza sativa Japonica Group]
MNGVPTTHAHRRGWSCDAAQVIDVRQSLGPVCDRWQMDRTGGSAPTPRPMSGGVRAGLPRPISH